MNFTTTDLQEGEKQDDDDDDYGAMKRAYKHYTQTCKIKGITIRFQHSMWLFKLSLLKWVMYSSFTIRCVFCIILVFFFFHSSKRGVWIELQRLLRKDLMGMKLKIGLYKSLTCPRKVHIKCL